MLRKVGIGMVFVLLSIFAQANTDKLKQAMGKNAEFVVENGKTIILSTTIRNPKPIVIDKKLILGFHILAIWSEKS